MESTNDQTMQQFFERFERSSAAGDADALAGLFAPSFLSASADGERIVTSGELVQAIPKRKQLFEKIGHRSTTLMSVHETKLDERYSLVRTEWRWRIARGQDAATDITLPSTFIVQRANDGPRIVFYLTGDIIGALRERGLLPAS